MQIDKLIAAAPDVDPPVFEGAYWDKLTWQLIRTKIEKQDTSHIERELERIWEPYNNFPKVAHGPYTLLNCKQALRAFKKKRAYSPRKPARRPGIKPLNKRVMGEDIIYTMPYKPRRVPKLPEFPSDRSNSGLYGAGFFCNSHYMVRIDKPKTKRPLKSAHTQMKKMIKEANGGQGVPVAVVEEMFNSAVNPWVAYARFYGPSASVTMDAAYLDVIYKYHPSARARYTGNQINFFVEHTLVGIAMPVR